MTTEPIANDPYREVGMDQPALAETLTPAQIAAREAEKSALLTQLRARLPQTVGETSGEAPPDVETLIEADGDEPGDVVEIADASPPRRPRSVELSLLLEQVQAEHQKAMEDVEIAFNARLTELVRQQGEARAEESRVVEPRLAKRLKEALANLSVPVNDGDAADVAAEARWHERLRVRTDAALAKAAETEKQLKAFEKTYGAMLEKLASVGRATWLGGLPTATSLQKSGAVQQVARLMAAAGGVRDSLSNAFENIAKQTAAITSLVLQAKLRGPWPIPATTRDGRECDMVQVLHELAMSTSGDMLSSLNERMQGLVAMIEDNAASKVKAAADGTATEPIEFEPSYSHQIEAKAAMALEDGGRCNLNYSPFDRGRREEE
jgi:hypothetical protein